MESALPMLCAIRCPKCLRVLSDSPENPLFRCFDCDSIVNDNGLNAKAKAQELGAPASSELSGKMNFKKFESSKNGGIEALSFFESEDEISKKKRESDGCKLLNDINERNSNHEGKNSSVQIVQENRNSLKWSHKVVQSLESLVIKANQKHRNVIGFMLRSRSFHDYDRNLSLSEKWKQDCAPQKHLPASRRTRSSRLFSLSDSVKSAARNCDLISRPKLIQNSDFLGKVVNKDEGKEEKADDEQLQDSNGSEKVLSGLDSAKSLKVAEEEQFPEETISREISGKGVKAKEHQDAMLNPRNIDEPSSISESMKSKNSEQVARFLKSLRDDGMNNEDDNANEALRNGFGFKLRSRSLHAYDQTFSLPLESLGDGPAPQKCLPAARRTRSSKAFSFADSIRVPIRRDFMKNSETYKPPLNSQLKDGEQVVNFSFSERDDESKILEKVDEPKVELNRMFSRKVDGKEAPGFSIKVTQLEGNALWNDTQSSLIPFSRQSSNSSGFLAGSAGTFRYNGSRRSNQEAQIRHCRPVSGGAPFVICYKCYKLLQLPADFLVSTKRIHKLRCGSCSEVLAYSFRPRARASLNKVHPMAKNKMDMLNII